MNNPSSSTSQPSGVVPGPAVGGTTPAGPVPVAVTLAGIQTLEDGLTDLVTLDRAKRRHTTRVSSAVLAQTPHLVQTVSDHPELKPPKVDPTALTSRLARATELTLVREKLGHLLRAVEDTILADRQECLADLLSIYDTIKVADRHEPGLAQVVATMEAILSKPAHVRARKAKALKKAAAEKAKTPAPEAPATGPAPAVTPATPSQTAPAEVPQVTVVTSGPKV